MKYEEEYKKSESMSEFVELCKKNKEYNHTSVRTFKRRYYDLKKLITKNEKNKKSWEPNGIDYEKIFRYSKDYKEFANRVINIYPQMKYSSAVRRYYDTRDKLKNVKPAVEEEVYYNPPESNIEDVKNNEDEKDEYYLPEEKIKPNYLKMLEFKDMKRLKKHINRDFLFKHGFSVLEINWLEDNEYIKRPEKY